MGNAGELTGDGPSEGRSFRSRLARLSTWDRVEAILLIPWLGVVIVNLGGIFWWEAPLRTWIALAAGAPFLLSIGFSLAVIASRASAEHVVDRNSILWRWLAGIGRGLRASTGLAIGAFLGGLVGSGIAGAATLGDLREPLQWVLLAVTSWVGVSMAWWTVVAAIDMGRLSRAARVEAVRQAFPNTRERRRGFPQFLAGLSSRSTVLLWGLIGLFLLLQGCAWALSALASL